MAKMKAQMRAVYLDTGQVLQWDRTGEFSPESWGAGGFVNDAIAHAFQPFNRAGESGVMAIALQMVVTRVPEASPEPLPLFDAADNGKPKKKRQSSKKGVDNGQ